MIDYPEGRNLETIRKWSHQTSLKKLMVYVKKLWWMPEWGWKETVDGSGRRVFTLATGGWSENEELINALRDNTWFWSTCWHSSEKGGKHIFKMPKMRGGQREII